MGHSRFSPSATEREYSCPASFLPNEQAKDQQSNGAAHGTSAHRIGELCLTKGYDVDRYAGCRLAVSETGRTRFITMVRPVEDDEREFEVDDEMVKAVQSYVDWCRELPGEHHVEIKVEHTRWCPDLDEFGEPLDPQYGTSDHNACIPANTGMFRKATLVITDLKYGKGLKVFAFENKQAIKYALGVYDKYDWIYGFERVIIRICQPRLNHFDVWELSVEELLAWGERIKKRLELVFVDNPPFGPSEKACKFCKIAATCKPREEFIFERDVFEFDQMMGEFVNDMHRLSADEIFAAYNMIPLVKERCAQLERYVLEQLQEGEEIGDRVLVHKGAHRKWQRNLTEDEVAEALAKDFGLPDYKIYSKSLRSPKQIEDALPKEKRAKLGELVFKPKGGPVVASPSDKRERYSKQEDVDDFDNLDAEGE